MRSSRSRRDFEEMKHFRNEISEDSEFTDYEIDIAGILILFSRKSTRHFLRWGSKGKRSALKGNQRTATHYSPRSEHDIYASQNGNRLEYGAMAMAPPPPPPPPPPPTRRLPPTSPPHSKNVIAKTLSRKKAPKKKTHRELAEMVHELSLENSRMIKEVEQRRKINQDLKDCNAYLKSQLALCLDQKQEQNMPYTARPSSSHSDTRPKTETPTACDNFKKCDEHENFEIMSGSSALISADEKLHRLGRPMYACSPESSVGFEKDGAMPTKDTVCSGFLDLNVPDESFFDTNISDDLHDQMPMYKN